MLSSTVLSALVAIFVVSRLIKYRSDRKKVLGLPGLRCLVTPAHPIGALLPTFFLNPGLSWQWYWRNQIYERAGASTISVLAWLFGDPTIYTTSIEVARQIVSTRGQFEKPPETTIITGMWGPNLFAVDGDEWRRHRRIMGPAFSTEVYALVWKEALSLFDDMVEVENWNNKSTVILDPVNDLTTKFALHIISRCAFGNTMPWRKQTGNSHTMDFAEALTIVSHSSIIRLVTPKWMYSLPIERLHKVDTAYNTLKTFMDSLIASRREEMSQGTASPRHDLFSLMLGTSEEEGTAAMTDSELSGNTFLMLFAGHETTARTLDAVLGFLALYQDVQKEIYEEIQAVYSEDPNLPFSSHSKLNKTQACFLEAARLFPAGFMMIRRTAEDVVVTTDDPHIHGGRLPLSKGTTLVVDMVGLHYNKRYFPDPEEFRPSRWYNARENDMSMFSFGSRACIGRRFALAEAVCFLARLLLGWQIEPVLREGESPSEWCRRVMIADVMMSLGVGKVPVRLVSRK